MPSRVLGPILALAVVVAGCSSTPAPDPRPEATSPAAAVDPTSTSAPTAEPTTPVPTTAPTTAPRPASVAAPEHTLSTSGGTFLGTVGRSTVVSTARGVKAYRDDGTVAWDVVAPRGYGDPESTLLVDDGVVVVSRDVPLDRDVPFPGRTQVRVLDATSGDLLWADDDASFASAGGGLVLTTGDCTGEQDALVGDCTVSAREPRTGAVRWSQPTYASARATAYLSGAVAVESYGANGSDVRTRTYDLDTGAPLSPFVTEAPTAVADGFLGVDHDDDTRDGCRQTVRRLNLDGTLRWRRVLRVGLFTRLDDTCRDYAVEPVTDGLAAVTSLEGRAWLLDLGTGATVWRGAPGEAPVTVRGDLLLTQTSTGGYLEAVGAADLRTGKHRWTFPVPDDVYEAPGPAALRGRTLVTSPGDCDSACTTWVLGLRDGALRATMAGELIRSGRSGTVTRSGRQLRFYAPRASRP